MFGVMFSIIPIMAIGLIIFVFILVFVLMFSPKARGKMMSKQIKATKYMVDETKDDIEDISTNLANATKDGIETTTRAIRKGFTEEEGMYCKHCGGKIDKDSTFCKHCGKEQ